MQGQGHWPMGLIRFRNMSSFELILLSCRTMSLLVAIWSAHPMWHVSVSADRISMFSLVAYVKQTLSLYPI